MVIKPEGDTMLAFIASFVKLFDLVAVVSLVLYTVITKHLMGADAAIVLLAFSLMRGAGHFWGLRLYHVICSRIRFIPLLGGYIQIEFFMKRIEEGAAAIGSSLWVLVSTLIFFGVYLVTDNLICLLYVMLSLGINIIALLPIGIDLDGVAVVKSVAFSISRFVGLMYMFMNAIAFPVAIYWFLSRNGQVDLLMIGPAVIAGFQRFSDEYNREYDIEPMPWTEMIALMGSYIALILVFLFLPWLMGLAFVDRSVHISALCIAKNGLIGLIILSILEGNIVFFITLKRRIFSNI